MKAYTGEFFGTFCLVLVGCGCAVLSAARPELGLGTVELALAFGMGALMATGAVFRVSGAHLNPAVSLALWASRRFPGRCIPPYVGAQVLGAVAAGWVLYVAGGAAGVDLAAGLAANGFAQHSPGGYSWQVALVIEIFTTAVFVLVFLGATDERFPRGLATLAPVFVGLGLALVHLVSMPVTNTSVNPARSTGLAIFSGPAALEQLWLFWLAPLAGGALGALAYGRGMVREPSQKTEAAQPPGDAQRAPLEFAP